MFEIMVLVASAADAQQAADLFQRLADDMSGRKAETLPFPREPAAETAAQAVSTGKDTGAADTATHADSVSAEATASPRRTRRKAQPDPVDAYVRAGGAMPEDEKGEPDAAEQSAVEQHAENTNTPEGDAAPVDARTRDDLIAEMRKTGTEKGALWFRELLSREKANKLSDLSDDALRRGLAGA